MRCKCCGVELRPGQLGLCKSCRQNIAEGQPAPSKKRRGKPA